MKLSCTEAEQSFISQFNQYSLVDPFWGNIPSWVWQWVNHWFRKLWRKFHTTVILETEFYENNNIFIPHPDKRKRKIVSTIHVIYAHIQINWARNIESNCLANNNLSRASPRSQMLWFFSVNYIYNSGVQPIGSNVLFRRISQYKHLLLTQYRADSRIAPSQWETALLCNDVSHWLGAWLESALQYVIKNILYEQSTYFLWNLIRSWVTHTVYGMHRRK